MNLNKHLLFTFKNYKSSKLEISMVKVKSKFKKMITSINDKNLKANIEIINVQFFLNSTQENYRYLER